MSGYSVSTTNNKMELQALLEGLKTLPYGVSAIVYSDSKYVLNTMRGMYNSKFNLDLIGQLHAERSKLSHIFYVWVRGHSGHYYNELADTIAYYCAVNQCTYPVEYPVHE